MDRGDILVTEMTTPDFVPGMKKAAAIITDTGGMTAPRGHSQPRAGRALCIVGTGNATSVLKDGMDVSVDGSHGLIYEGFVSAPEAAAQGGPENDAQTVVSEAVDHNRHEGLREPGRCGPGREDLRASG